MPKLNDRIDVNATPEAAFAYVSDLTKHGEWSANSLKITPAGGGPVAVGKEYRSVAKAPTAVKADLRVTKYQPSNAFAFAGKDMSGSFEHTFTIAPKDGGCTIERAVDFRTSPMFTLLYPVLGPLIGRPAARKSMQQLKARLEQAK